MIAVEHLLLTLVVTVFGVSIGSYLGAKVMKRELKREVSAYLTNELPHLLESEEFKVRVRGWIREMVREAVAIGKEELGIGLPFNPEEEDGDEQEDE